MEVSMLPPVTNNTKQLKLLEDLFKDYGVRSTTIIKVMEMGFTVSTLVNMMEQEIDDVIKTMMEGYQMELLVGEQYGLKSAIKAEKKRQEEMERQRLQLLAKNNKKHKSDDSGMVATSAEGPKFSEEPVDSLKYMKAFANYAVGDLSIEESNILSIPSPNTVFKPSGEVFHLFVRRSYLNLIRHIYGSNRRVKIFSVRGTSGTGQSVFGMLWLLLEAQRGGKVIWHIGGRFILFNFKNKHQVEVERLDKNSAEKWMDEDGVWFIADGQYLYQFAGQCNALQVCSFNEQNFHEFSKTPGCQILYNPVWTEDELRCYVRKCKALNYETIDEEEVKKCFPILGGVARYLLQCEESTEDDVAGTAQDRVSKSKQLINDAIENFPGTVSQLLQVLTGTYVEKFSDKLVHCFTAEYFCSVRRMEFASDYVKKLMFSYLMKKDKHEFRKWLESYKNNPSVDCLWGGFFEMYAHQVLQQGGSFKLQKIWDDTDEEELVMNSNMDRLVVSNLKDLERLEKESYCKLPGGYDSLFSKPNEPPVFFQMFKGETGSYGNIFEMRRQIDETMKRPAYKLVIVAPKHRDAPIEIPQYHKKMTPYLLSLDFSFIEKA